MHLCKMHLLCNSYVSTLNLFLPYIPAAAEPTCGISIDVVNATKLNVTWPEPSGIPATGYVIHFESKVDQDIHIVDDGLLGTTATINVYSTDLAYIITVVTISTMLPSQPSLPAIHSKT